MELEIKGKFSYQIKEDLQVSFRQIVEKCETVGDLQKLHQKVRELNTEFEK